MEYLLGSRPLAVAAGAGPVECAGLDMTAPRGAGSPYPIQLDEHITLTDWLNSNTRFHHETLMISRDLILGPFVLQNKRAHTRWRLLEGMLLLLLLLLPLLLVGRSRRMNAFLSRDRLQTTHRLPLLHAGAAVAGRVVKRSSSCSCHTVDDRSAPKFNPTKPPTTGYQHSHEGSVP